MSTLLEEQRKYGELEEELSRLYKANPEVTTTIGTKIVGCQYYGGVRNQYSLPGRQLDQIRWKTEPTNAHDKNAIQVFTDSERSVQIGYICREHAALLNILFQEDRVGSRQPLVLSVQNISVRTREIPIKIEVVLPFRRAHELQYYMEVIGEGGTHALLSKRIIRLRS